MLPLELLELELVGLVLPLEPEPLEAEDEELAEKAPEELEEEAELELDAAGDRVQATSVELTIRAMKAALPLLISDVSSAPRCGVARGEGTLPCRKPGHLAAGAKGWLVDLKHEALEVAALAQA
jgi:hypothetical protein